MNKYYERNRENKKEYARKYYWENRDKVQEYRKENDRNKKQCKDYYQRHKTELLEKERKRKKLCPERFNAKWKVRDAVKNRILKKPDGCQSCNETRDLQGHHKDYDKPLEVMWLCRECHEKVGGR